MTRLLIAFVFVGASLVSGCELAFDEDIEGESYEFSMGMPDSECDAPTAKWIRNNWDDPLVQDVLQHAIDDPDLQPISQTPSGALRVKNLWCDVHE